MSALLDVGADARRVPAVAVEPSNRFRVESVGCGWVLAPTGGRYDCADAADWYAACCGRAFAFATGFGMLGSFIALERSSGIKPCVRFAAGDAARVAFVLRFACGFVAEVSPIHEEKIPVFGAWDADEIPDDRRLYDAGATFSSRFGAAAVALAEVVGRRRLPTSSCSDAVVPERNGLPADPTRPLDTSPSRSAKSIDDSLSAAVPIDAREKTINEMPSPIGK